MSADRRNEARRAIEGLQLPSVVLRIFDGEEIHAALSYRVQSPYYSFTSDCGLDSTFVPFWECGVEVSGYSRSCGRYQQISLESPDEPSFSGATFRALFCDLLIFLREDEHDDATLREIASLFEMPPIDSLLRSLQTQPPYSTEIDWEQRRTSVIRQYENS